MSANAGEGDGQGMVEVQIVPDPDIGGTASALLGMAVDDEEEDWEDCSDSEQSDCDEENWKIGLVEAPVVPEALNPEFFPSKVGGDPAWLDPENLPSDADLRCQAKVRGETCGQRLSFLLQVYAPISDGPPEAFHRSIFLFVCSNVLCCGKQGSVRAFRSQLPRENPYYSHEPPEYPDERPKVSEIVEEEEEKDMSGAAADAVVEAGRKCKEEGNMLYKASDYEAAVSKYCEALEQMRATACAHKKTAKAAREEAAETACWSRGSKAPAQACAPSTRASARMSASAGSSSSISRASLQSAQRQSRQTQTTSRHGTEGQKDGRASRSGRMLLPSAPPRKRATTSLALSRYMLTYAGVC